MLVAAAAALGLPVATLSGVSPAPAAAAAPTLSSIIPAPVETHPASGADFTLTAQTAIKVPAGSAALGSIGERLAQALRPSTGFALPVTSAPASSAPVISLVIGPAEAVLGDQGYRLTVARNAVTIIANKPAGVFAGTQSLRQLLPTAIDATTVQHRTWRVPGGSILDYPRFGYRGAMLDEARHFHSVESIKAYIDEMARFKINYLHLHLADDQGWRIQIDSWPLLTTISGAPGTGVDGTGGGYLTKAQYADLVAYAGNRYITIIPEIDMPGHVNAAQVAYPELTCDGKAPRPRTDTDVGYSSLCISKDVTYRFVDDVVRELAAMTPGPYIHIGGDEAQATTAADYLTFEAKVLPIVAKYGKTAYGWHDIAKSPSSSAAVLQFWDTSRTNASVATAVAKGSKVVMSPANRAYLDMKYNASTPLGQDWAGLIEVQTAYGWDPGTWVSGVPERSVLGVEAPLWSETLRSLDDIEFMAFPRLAAIAELGWSPKAALGWTGFRSRLGAYGPRWTLQGVNFYRSTQVVWS
jgi:hexosaminidase